MWFLFQGLILFAVGASNILYHWTPNSYLVGLAGLGLAWSLTWLVSSLMARPGHKYPRLLERLHRPGLLVVQIVIPRDHLSPSFGHYAEEGNGLSKDSNSP